MIATKINLDHFINANTKLVKRMQSHGVDVERLTREEVPSKPKRTAGYVRALCSASMQRIHVPDMTSLGTTNPDVGDFHMTPMGARVVYDEWRKQAPSKWAHNWVTQYLPDKLYPLVLEPYTMYEGGKGSLLIPRGLHAVFSQSIKIPHLAGTQFDTVEWKGMEEHLLAYAQEEQPLPDELLDLFDQALDQVLATAPLPPRWGQEVQKKEWFSRIRTNSSSGWPYYVRQGEPVYVIDEYNIKKSKDSDVIFKEWIFEKEYDRILKADYEDIIANKKKILYTNHHRNQQKKDRVVSGGAADDKPFGAALNHVTLAAYMDSFIAWGNFESIFGDIREWFSGAHSVISVDFSGLDKSFKFVLIKKIISKLKEYWTRVDHTYERVLDYVDYIMTDGAWMVIGPDYYFKVLTGMLSGTPWTQFLDSLLVAALSEMAKILYGIDFKYKCLGDDLIWVSEDDISEEFQKWITIMKNFGFSVSREKSYPSTADDGFGVFLQYVIYKDGDDVNIIGNLLRKITNLIFMERDSSVLKSFDIQRYFDEADGKVEYKKIWMIRTIQILASMVPNNLPNEMMDDVVSWVGRYDKFIGDEQLVMDSMALAEEYRTKEDWWHLEVTDPKVMTPYLLSGTAASF